MRVIDTGEEEMDAKDINSVDVKDLMTKWLRKSETPTGCLFVLLHRFIINLILQHGDGSIRKWTGESRVCNQGHLWTHFYFEVYQLCFPLLNS